MAEGRDFTAEAYQPPFLEQHGPMIGGLLLVVLAIVGLLRWQPWVDQGRGITALRPGEPIRVSVEPNVTPLQARNTNRVAIHGAAVYITWVDTRTSPASLILAISNDTGKTFREVVVDTPTASRQLSEPEILCNADGAVFILYTYFKGVEKKVTKTEFEGKTTSGPAGMNFGGEATVRLARSDDQGATWEQISNVASAYTNELHDAVMGIDANDVIHIAAFARIQGIDQVVVTKSVNRAESFEPDRQVSTAMKGSRRDLGIGVSGDGRVAVVWSDRRNAPEVPENGTIYGSVANVNAEFSPEIVLIKPELTPGRQRYPQVLLTDSGELGVVFVEGVDRTYRDKTELRYAHSTTFGAEFGTPVRLFGNQLVNAAEPQLAHDTGNHWYLTCLGTMTDYDQPTAVIAHSRDGGKSFRNLTPLVDRHSITVEHPSVAVQENTLIASYFDYADPSGAPGSAEVYAVRLEDITLRP